MWNIVAYSSSYGREKQLSKCFLHVSRHCSCWFFYLLTNIGKLRQYCEVVWRNSLLLNNLQKKISFSGFDLFSITKFRFYFSNKLYFIDCNLIWIHSITLCLYFHWNCFNNEVFQITPTLNAGSRCRVMLVMATTSWS